MKRSRLTAIAADVVAATQRRLPAAVREPAKRVPVCFEESPGDDLVADGLEPDLLGLFVGPSHDAEAGASDAVPPQILLFLANLWDYAEEDVAAYREEVRLTYLHELGHYLGWDESDLEARGLD